MGVGIGVGLGVSVGVAVGIGVWVGVLVGVCVAVGLGVCVGLGVSVAVGKTACCMVMVGVAVDGGTAAIPGGGGSDVEIYEFSSSSRRSAFAKAPTPRIARRMVAANQIVHLRLLDEGGCVYSSRFRRCPYPSFN